MFDFDRNSSRLESTGMLVLFALCVAAFAIALAWTSRPPPDGPCAAVGCRVL